MHKLNCYLYDCARNDVKDKQIIASLRFNENIFQKIIPIAKRQSNSKLLSFYTRVNQPYLRFELVFRSNNRTFRVEILEEFLESAHLDFQPPRILQLSCDYNKSSIQPCRQQKEQESIEATMRKREIQICRFNRFHN